ncbi:EAL domain-containing protein [Aquaspirillum serpens]|uniref:EAL domain-containing protein n=1 Tax=Aquaspirillum serpens TaxID=190 RepID=UPI00048681DA|nr:EAL domain-containing protein [Aquaspirillum serpens]
MKLVLNKTVEQVISPSILSCPPTTTLSEAGKMMRDAMCGSIIVMDEGRAIGIWTEADALDLDFADPHTFERPISEVMSSPVKTLAVGTPFSEAVIRFKQERIRHYLVVNAEGSYCGILSQTDVVLNQGAEFFLKLKSLDSIPFVSPEPISERCSFADAVAKMRAAHLEAIVVFFDDGAYGILTQRDVLWHLNQRTTITRVGDIASRPMITARASSSLYYARKLLAEKHIRHLGVTDEHGGLIGVVSFSDILTSIEHEYVNELQYALKERDEALNLSRQNLRLADKVFDSTLEGIVITDANGIIETVNPAFTRITGWRKEEVLGKSPRILNSGLQPPEFYQHMWASLYKHGVWEGEVTNRRKDGKLYSEHLTITGIRDNSGNFTHFAGIFTDITQRKLAEERLHFLANHDALTGLPNRTLFMERMNQGLAAASRHQRLLALMFFDLDRFKFVNDTLGHAAGDQLLKTVATRLTSLLRDSDTVARLGGDEFTVILEDIRDIQSIAQVAKKIIDSLAGMMRIGEHDVYVTASVGISVYPEDGQDVQTLLMNADTAMYRAKEQGKNTFRFFTADMNTATLERMRLETSLHQAINNNEMQVYYQPKYELRTGRMNGLEALLRWQHPELGFVSPGEFIPIAEESSLIVLLGRWVLDRACADARRWLDEGCLPGPVAVNLSHRQLKMSDDIVTNVRDALEQHNLPAHCLELEITESAAMENAQATARTLSRLKELGVRLAIDDFGTGYSSLAYLKQLPIGILKIDRSFVMDLHQDRDDAAITSAIISLAKSLELQVVAEGIENVEQLNFLRDKNCESGQGYFFSRPLPVEEIDELLHEQFLLHIAL